MTFQNPPSSSPAGGLSSPHSDTIPAAHDASPLASSPAQAAADSAGATPQALVDLFGHLSPSDDVCRADAPSPRAQVAADNADDAHAADVERLVSLATSLNKIGGYGPAALAGVPPEMRKEVEAELARDEERERKDEAPFEAMEGPVSHAGDALDMYKGVQQESKLGPLSLFTNFYDLAAGANDVAHGKPGKGGLQMAKGAVGTAGTIAETVGAEGAGKKFGKVGGAIDVADGIRKIHDGDVPGGIEETVSGGLEWLPNGSALSAAWKTGTTVGHALDNLGAKQDLFGDGRTAQRRRPTAARTPKTGSHDMAREIG